MFNEYSLEDWAGTKGQKDNVRHGNQGRGSVGPRHNVAWSWILSETQVRREGMGVTKNYLKIYYISLANIRLKITQKAAINDKHVFWDASKSQLGKRSC